MLPYNVHKNKQGFTLIETIAMTVIVSILAAVAAPSLWGMYNRFKLNDALNQLRSNLQEAQRVAIRNSQNCTVTLPNSNTENVTITSPCFKSPLNFDGDLQEITLRHNYSSTTPSNTITFTFQGRTNTQGTLVLSMPNTNDQKCLVTSIGLGLMRAGDYAATDTTNATAANCTTKQQ